MEEDTRDKLTEKFFRKSYPTTLKKKIWQEVIGLLQLSKVQYLPNFNIQIFHFDEFHGFLKDS